VTLKAATEADVLTACLPVIIGDAQYLSHWARRFGLARGFEIINRGEPFPAESADLMAQSSTTSIMSLARLSWAKSKLPGGKAAAEYHRAAVLCVSAGDLDAITTAPINKKSLHLGGYPFPGHTEFLAHLTNCDDLR
jgi:4-hydroxythreonine-4-phosphate dehydrogenase